MPSKTLIIGGSSGIGLATKDLLTSQGHQVIATSRETFDVTQAGGNLEIPDVLDGIVYCPGTINLKPFHRLSEADFMNDLQVNFLGALVSYNRRFPRSKNPRAPRLFSSAQSPSKAVCLFTPELRPPRERSKD